MALFTVQSELDRNRKQNRIVALILDNPIYKLRLALKTHVLSDIEDITIVREAFVTL